MMLLKIEVNPEDIILNKDGRIVVRVTHYGPFANAAWLTIHDGETVGDLVPHRAKRSGKTLFIGVNGGMKLDGGW